MSSREYKLVPIKIFNYMNQKNKTPSEIIPCQTDNNNNNINNNNNNNNNNSDEVQRSIRSIHEENQKELEKKGGNNDTICDYYTDSPPKDVISGGYSDKNVPLWISNDLATLPEYHRATNIRNSFNNIKDILDSEDLSESMKVRLYSFFKQKYDNARVMPDTSYLNDEEFLGYGSRASVLLATVTKIQTVYKRHLAKSIGNILLNNSKYIVWDKLGNLFIPPNTKIESLNLEKLLDILISRKKGSLDEIKTIGEIIKPFYSKLEIYIKNAKIIKNFKGSNEGKLKDIKYII